MTDGDTQDGSGRFEVLGCRGSSPASGSGVVAYGGETSSFAVQVDEATTIIIDAGTGLSFAPHLVATGHTYHLFYTHFHLDHVIGLPFFHPIHDPSTHFVFYGCPPSGLTLEAALGGTFRPPWFPVAFDGTRSAKTFVDVTDRTVQVGDVTVVSTGLRHPQGSVAYRLDRDGRSVVLATDHEAGDDEVDDRLVEMARNADVLIHDAQYTPEEYPAHVGWGHSTFEAAARCAVRAEVGRLLLTSHDPNHDDDAIDAIVARTSERFGAVAGAAPGVQIPL